MSHNLKEGGPLQILELPNQVRVGLIYKFLETTPLGKNSWEMRIVTEITDLNDQFYVHSIEYINIKPHGKEGGSRLDEFDIYVVGYAVLTN